MLGAASLGLVLEGLDESVRAEPPAVSVVVATGGERGLMAGSSGCGVATAEDGGREIAAGVGERAAAAERAEVAAGGSRFADADPDGDAGEGGEVGGSGGIACMTAARA